MKIYIIGIGGIGLSAIARFLKYQGYSVLGSDLYTTKITKSLEKEGIKVFIPHCKDNISKDIDLIIYSAVIKEDNEELKKARELNIKALSRKEALKFILKDKKVYSICGAHGKSTTSAILASILNSSCLLGAISKEFNSNFRYKSNLVVFEADESDGSFLNSNPYCAIVTNTEPEHMEYYNYDYDKFYQAYKDFLNIAKERVVFEDEFIKTLDDKFDRLKEDDIKDISYFLKDSEPYTRFKLKDYGYFEVYGFGKHIAIDASLAILAAIKELDIEIVRRNILNYKGIKKRFDIIQKKKNFILIDDYAHHPTEIKATIKSLKIYSKLIKLDFITMIWQPHKYSRTIDNLEAFKECFEGINQLIILPVWSAGEKEIFIDFKKEFSRYNPIFVDKIKSFDGYIIAGDLKISNGIVIGVGAGDITYQLNG